MLWAQIALMVIKLVLELPAVTEWLERIFGALKRAKPAQLAREAPRLFKALSDKCAGVDGPCPVQALALTLEAKYGV